MICVYLLKSLKDGKQYIGSTITLNKRLQQHNAGTVTSTKYRRPLMLVGYQPCETLEEAARFDNRYMRRHETLNRAMKNGKFDLVK